MGNIGKKQSIEYSFNEVKGFQLKLNNLLIVANEHCVCFCLFQSFPKSIGVLLTRFEIAI